MSQIPTVNILRLVLVDNALILLMLHTINKVFHVMCCRHGQHGLEIVPDSRSHYKLDQRVGLDGAEVLNCKFVVCADHRHMIS